MNISNKVFSIDASKLKTSELKRTITILKSRWSTEHERRANMECVQRDNWYWVYPNLVDLVDQREWCEQTFGIKGDKWEFVELEKAVDHKTGIVKSMWHGAFKFKDEKDRAWYIVRWS